MRELTKGDTREQNEEKEQFHCGLEDSPGVCY